MNPSQLIVKIDRLHALTVQVKGGLMGKPFAWGAGEANAYMPILAGIGITLITKTQVKKRGYVLKRGVKPVGSRYYGAPIQKRADLYVLECQCKPKAQAAADTND